MFSVLYYKIKKSRDWLLEHKMVRRSIFAFGLIAAAVGVLYVFLPTRTLAADPTVVSLASDSILGWFSKWVLLPFIEFGLKMCVFVLSFVIKIASYNGYLQSPAVNIGWVLVRDITNMFFVVILLLIAFGTILGIEQYEWKRLLVKFILAAIFVNFSRIICGVIIDAAQVVMMTFVNGVAATAGGNLIKAFSFEKIVSLSKNVTTDSVGGVNVGGLEIGGVSIFVASVAGVFFVSLLLAVLFVYMIMLVARLVTLWVLIVLSPFAFVLSVIPQTQKYASQWWSQFGNNVISGPLVIFFVWLSFVTIGGGDVASQTGLNFESINAETGAITTQTAGVSQYLDWTNMANFFIGIAMLMIGIKMAQSLGVAGGGLMGKALDFGKKVATVASGYAAGRWLYEKAGKPAAKWAAMNVPIVGGKAWVRRGKSIAAVSKKYWSQQVSQRRDYYAKKLESEGKKKYQTEEEVDKLIREGKLDKGYRESEIEKRLAEKGIGVGVTAGAWRGVKGFLAGRLESEGRAEKRVKNLETAAESEKKVEEGEYSLSSSWGGKMKTLDNARAALSERKQKAKGARYEAETIQKLMVEDRRDLEAQNAIIKSTTATADEKAKAKDKIKDLESRLAIGAIAAEAQSKPATEESAEELARAVAAYSASDTGLKYIHRTEMAEAGKKAAEDFVKEIKSSGLRNEFRKAAEEMEKIISDAKMDPVKVEQALSKAARSNNYIESLVFAKRAAEVEKEKVFTERQAQDKATDAVVGVKRGVRLPSTVLGEESLKRMREMFGDMGQKQSMQLAAQTMATLSAKKARTGKLDVGEEMDLKAATDYAASEAWNDDTYGYIFDSIGDIIKKDDKGQYIKGADGKFELKADDGTREYSLAKSMHDLYIDKLGWQKADGYGARQAGDILGLATYGGDADMVMAHREIERVQSERETKLSDAAKVDFKNTQEDSVRQAATTQFNTQKNEIAESVVKASLSKEQYLKVKKEIDDYGQGWSVGLGMMKEYEHLLHAVDEEIESLVAQEVEAKKQSHVSKSLEANAGQLNYRTILREQSALEDGVGGTLNKILNRGKKTGKNEHGNYAAEEEFIGRNKKAQDFMQSGEKMYNQWAGANGHWQLGRVINYDTGFEGGMMRLNTTREAKKDVIVDLSKQSLSKLLESQYQSYGQIDADTGLFKRIDEHMIRAIGGSISRESDMRVPLRTLMRLNGYATGEDKRFGAGGFFKLGGAKLTETMTNATERSEHLIKDILIPQLLGHSKMAMLGIKKLGGHLKLAQISKGIMNIEIDGTPGGGRFDTVETLVERLESGLADTLHIDAETVARLKLVAKQFKGKGMDFEQISTRTEE